MSEATEQTDPSQDKQSRIKLKLKKMGVFRDASGAPAAGKKSFWRGKLPVILVILLAILFWWWYSGTQQTDTPQVADTAQAPQQMPMAYPPEPGYGPPPMPPQPMPHWSTPPTQDSTQASSETSPTTPMPGWSGPGNRYDDRFGPPPGWQPDYQPPPPGYYGHPYYGPPPPAYYPNPYYWNYGPPPPGYWR